MSAQCFIEYRYDSKYASNLEKNKIDSITISHYEVNNSFGEISRGAKKCEHVVLFNNDGTVKKITKKNSIGEINSVRIHEYENGIIKLISGYNNQGKLQFKTVFTEVGKDIREQTYASDGSLNNQYFIRSYDSLGNMIKEVWKYNDKKEVMREDVFEYYFDTNHRVIKSINNGKNIKIITYNDKNSKCIEKIERIDPKSNKLEQIKRFEYDYQNNIIKKYIHNKLSYSYEFVYDNKNNWIKETEFNTEAEIPNEIIERKISYSK